MSEPLILTLKRKVEELEKRKTNMIIYTTSEQSYSHTGNNIYLQEPLRFQGSRGNSGDKLTFETNGIKIGAGINHINVKGIVTFIHSESDGRPVYLYIRKNGNISSTQIMYMQTTQPYTMAIFKDYIEVEEGDLIQLYVAMDNANFKTAGNTDNQLTVEVVD
ncbi:unknown [Clostridium sp. CAG:354]|jgi:hypothetical protein|nr:hypothetical protein [Clostridium sp.]CDE11051.1 unknown [Clostridium sp. CAG:354]